MSPVIDFPEDEPDYSSEDFDEIIALAARRLSKLGGGNKGGRYVRTPEGSRFYGQPIGTLITPDIIARAEKKRGKKGPRNALAYNPITSGRPTAAKGSRPNEVGSPTKNTPHPIEKNTNNQPGQKSNVQKKQKADALSASTPRDPASAPQAGTPGDSDRPSAYFQLGQKNYAVPQGSKVIRRRDKDLAFVQTPSGDVKVFGPERELDLGSDEKSRVSEFLRSDVSTMKNYQEEFPSPTPPAPEVGATLPDAQSLRELPPGSNVTIGDNPTVFQTTPDGKIYPVSERGETFGVPLDPEDLNFDRGVVVKELPDSVGPDDEEIEARMREDLEDIASSLDSAIQGLSPEQRKPFEELRARVGRFDQPEPISTELAPEDATSGEAPDPNAPETEGIKEGDLISSDSISKAQPGDVVRAFDDITNSNRNFTKRDDGMWYARGEDDGYEDEYLTESFPEATYFKVASTDAPEASDSPDSSETDAPETTDTSDSSISVDFDRVTVGHIQETRSEDGGVWEKIASLDTENDETELDLTDDEVNEFLEGSKDDPALAETRKYVEGLRKVDTSAQTPDASPAEKPAEKASPSGTEGEKSWVSKTPESEKTWNSKGERQDGKYGTKTAPLPKVEWEAPVETPRDRRRKNLASRDNASEEDLSYVSRGARAFALDKDGNVVTFRRNSDGKWAPEDRWKDRQNLAPDSSEWGPEDDRVRDGYTSEELRKEFKSVSVDGQSKKTDEQKREIDRTRSEREKRIRQRKIDSAARTSQGVASSNALKGSQRDPKLKAFVEANGREGAIEELNGMLTRRSEQSIDETGNKPSVNEMQSWVNDFIDDWARKNGVAGARVAKGKRGRREMPTVDDTAPRRSNSVADPDLGSDSEGAPSDVIPKASEVGEGITMAPRGSRKRTKDASTPEPEVEEDSNEVLDEAGTESVGIDEDGNVRVFRRTDNGDWISSGEGYSPYFYSDDEVDEAVSKYDSNAEARTLPVPSDQASPDQGYAGGVRTKPEALSGEWSLEEDEPVTKDWFDNAPSGSSYRYKDAVYVKDVDGQWRKVSGRDGYFNPRSEGVADNIGPDHNFNIFDPNTGEFDDADNPSKVISTGDGSYRPYYISDEYNQVRYSEEDLNAMPDGATLVAYSPPDSLRVNNVSRYRVFQKKNGKWQTQAMSGMDADGLEPSQLGINNTYLYKAETQDPDMPGYQPDGVNMSKMSPRVRYYRRDLFSGEIPEGGIVYRVRTDKETNTTGEKTYSYRMIGTDEETGADLWIGGDFTTNNPATTDQLNRTLGGEFFVDTSPMTLSNYRKRKADNGNRQGAYLTDDDISPLVHPEAEIPPHMDYFNGDRLQKFSQLFDYDEGAVVRVQGAPGERDTYLRREEDGWHKMNGPDSVETDVTDLSQFASAFRDPKRGIRFESFGGSYDKDDQGIDLTPDGHSASVREVRQAIEALDSYDGPHIGSALSGLKGSNILADDSATMGAFRARVEDVYGGNVTKEKMSSYLKTLINERDAKNFPGNDDSGSVSIGGSGIVRAGAKGADGGTFSRRDVESAISELEGSNSSQMKSVLSKSGNPLANLSHRHVLEEAYGRDRVQGTTAAERKQMFIDHLRGKLDEPEAPESSSDSDRPIDEGRPGEPDLSNVSGLTEVQALAKANSEYAAETESYSDLGKVAYVRLKDASDINNMGESLKSRFPGIYFAGFDTSELAGLSPASKASRSETVRRASLAFLDNMEANGFDNRHLPSLRMVHSGGLSSAYASVSASDDTVMQMTVYVPRLTYASEQRGARTEAQRAFDEGHFLGDNSKDFEDYTIGHEFAHVQDFVSGGPNMDQDKELFRGFAQEFNADLSEDEITAIFDGYFGDKVLKWLSWGDSAQQAEARRIQQASQKVFADFLARVQEKNSDFDFSRYSKSNFREFIAEAIAVARFYPGSSNASHEYIRDAIYARVARMKEGS